MVAHPVLVVSTKDGLRRLVVGLPRRACDVRADCRVHCDQLGRLELTVAGLIQPPKELLQLGVRLALPECGCGAAAGPPEDLLLQVQLTVQLRKLGLIDRAAAILIVLPQGAPVLSECAVQRCAARATATDWYRCIGDKPHTHPRKELSCSRLVLSLVRPRWYRSTDPQSSESILSLGSRSQ
eukprot:10558-Prymnesium_polylepis.1